MPFHRRRRKSCTYYGRKRPPQNRVEISYVSPFIQRNHLGITFVSMFMSNFFSYTFTFPLLTT